MPATTAPDFRPVRDVPVLVAEPGSRLQLAVLAADEGHLAGVELGTGVLVRSWLPPQADGDVEAERRPQPLHVVAVTVSGAEVPDPTAPEALAVEEPPVVVGRIGARGAERLLRPLLHPGHLPLLGSSGPTVPSWERSADSPSIAVVEPPGGVAISRQPGYLGCRFTWQGQVRELPCLDRQWAAELDRQGVHRQWLEPPTRLVVGLTPPRQGHCRKVVHGLLRRP